MSTTGKSTNKLGLLATTSLVIGNMIGAGIFLLPAALAAYGGISLIGWFFSATGMILTALVLSKLSKLLPGVNGGLYVYTKEGFGNFTGFFIAWGYVISVWCTNAAITVSLVSALSTFFPVLGHSPFAAAVTGLSGIWLLTWINTKGIAVTGTMQLVTTILKITPLIIIAVAGLFFINPHNFVPFNLSGASTWQAISATTAMTVFAFTGIECATIPADNVKDPAKTVPRATMLGTIITTLIYVLCTVSVLGLVAAAQLKQSVTPLADAAVKIFGAGAAYWVSAGVAIAAFGALNGWILIQGQIPHAMAKDVLFPAVFAKENKKGVPSAGIIIGSVIVSLIMLMNYTKGLVEQFKFLILLATLTAVIPYLFSIVAYAIIKFRKENISSNTITAIILATIAFVFSFWFVAGTGEETVYWGFLLMLAGIPLYVWMKYKQE